MTPPERGGGYEFKPDFEENPSLGNEPDPDELDPDEDSRGEPSERGGYYDSDDDAGSGGLKGFQLGCGALIILGLVLAIVVPVFGSFGGGGGGVGGGQTAGGEACNLVLDTIEAASEGGLDNATFIEKLREIAASAADAEPPIRDSSAALSAAANGLITATSEAEVIGLQAEIDTQFDNLIAACVDARYLTRSG